MPQTGIHPIKLRQGNTNERGGWPGLCKSYFSFHPGGICFSFAQEPFRVTAAGFEWESSSLGKYFGPSASTPRSAFAYWTLARKVPSGNKKMAHPATQTRKPKTENPEATPKFKSRPHRADFRLSFVFNFPQERPGNAS